MADPTLESVFFAYAGTPPLRAEVLREAVDALNARGVRAQGWEDLSIGGRLIVDTVTERIKSSTVCVAEISSSNPNVLFEAGYAIALGKRVLLAIDETDEAAVRNWMNFGLIATIGRVQYTGNDQILADAIFRELSTDAPLLIESLLAGGKSNEANALFAPRPPHKTTQAQRLVRLLERQTHLVLLAAQEDFGFSPLSFYVQELFRSSAVLLHFVSPNKVNAEQYNARLALIAGIAYGLGRPLLMVADPDYVTPLDYKDMLYTYPSVAALIDHVEHWLTSTPTTRLDKKRFGRTNVSIELPIRTFGSYVAESESRELTGYFVNTNEFEAILSGRSSVFVGRKGTGKTANMLQATTDLRVDRRNLVVPIKPMSYDLSALTTRLTSVKASSDRDYFLLQLWGYLLISEIALRCVSHAEDLPAGIVGGSPVEALERALEKCRISADSDFTSRLDEVISGDSLSISEEMSKDLRFNWRHEILPSLSDVLKSYDRVCVLVDNLDKTWERGVDYEMLSRFILGLLVAAGRLESEILGSDKRHSQLVVTMIVFLRTDIYDVMTKFAREPDKINPQQIRWNDEELLIRVLEERFLAHRPATSTDSPSDMWETVFCSEVHGLPTRDYFLWRALRRPRDIIFLGNAALNTAINRKHEKVLSQDFVLAEAEYSRFAIEALLVESEAQGLNLENTLLDFAGLNSVVTSDELKATISGERYDETIDWLIQTSFLGLEDRGGDFVYVEGEIEARKKIKVASRIAARSRSEMRYKVHPAFRPYLEISDDDIQVARVEP